MTTRLDLKEVERKAYRSNFQDGLWDIYLGLLLLQMAFGLPLLNAGLSPVWIMLLMVGFVIAVLAGFLAAKKWIITPRLGLVTFGQERQKKNKKLTLILSLSALAGVVILLLSTVAYQLVSSGLFDSWSETIWLIPFGLFLVTAVTVFSLGAYYMDYTRAYLYGWFFGLAFPLNILLEETLGITIPMITILFSAIMIGIGLILFIRFIRTHPVPVPE